MVGRTSRIQRGFRVFIATLVALIAIIAAGLIFATTLLRPPGPVAESPTPSATASGTQSLPAVSAAPLVTAAPVAPTTRPATTQPPATPPPSTPRPSTPVPTATR